MPRYDIHFQGVSADDLHGFRCFEFAYAAPLKMTGLQALINRFAKTLMTPVGSDILNKDYGTVFGGLIGSNISRGNSLVSDTVEMSVADAAAQVRRQDIDGGFDDTEQLMSAEVIGYEPKDTGFEVWIRLKNKAGESAETAVATIGVSKY
jgi:hypothetical protein